MDLFLRWLRRIVIGCIALLAIWLIVTQVFERLNERLPLFVALFVTYLLSAYVILPPLVQLGLMLTRRGRIPRFTSEPDGLPADPVNILLIGTEKDLTSAFGQIGWYPADRLSFGTALRMIGAFARNRPYPTAPFRRLYLFGRSQDHGFQEPIGSSPRQRHHVRFWAANVGPELENMNLDTLAEQVKFWSQKQKLDPLKPIVWVGSATKDIGFAFTRLTYQVTHKVDADVDEEREYLLASLRDASVISNESYVDPGKFIGTKYISDGRILTATLAQSDYTN